MERELIERRVGRAPSVVLGTGTRVTGYPFQYPLPGYPADTRLPGYHSIPVLFFHKVRDTLFLSDNLNTTARAVDALHLHHKTGLQGWVPFIAPALLRVPAMSKRVSFEVALG